MENIIDLFQEKILEHGMIICKGEEAGFYLFSLSEEKAVSKPIQTKISNRTRRGGQSQNRYMRLNDEEVDNFIKKIHEKARTIFTRDGYPLLKSLIIVGPGEKKTKLHRKLMEDPAFKNILKSPMTTNGEYYECLDKARESLSLFSNGEEKKIREQFETILRTNPDILVFGKDEIDKLARDGLIKELYTRSEESPFPTKTLQNIKITKVNTSWINDYEGLIGVKWY